MSISDSTPSSPTPPATLVDGLPLPKLFVFDLDYTLWPFWVDTHPLPPIKFTGRPNSVLDATGTIYSFYPTIPIILTTLRQRGIKIAAASRTHSPELARQMAGLLTFPPDATRTRDLDEKLPERLWDCFDHAEIYPGSKIAHFRNIKKSMGVEFEDMVFFDDESRNLNVERELGVVTVIVKRGVTGERVDEAVRRWRNLKNGKGKVDDGKKKSKREKR